MPADSKFAGLNVIAMLTQDNSVTFRDKQATKICLISCLNNAQAFNHRRAYTQDKSHFSRLQLFMLRSRRAPFTQATETGAIMLIKKADVKNHLAAKLRKHHILQGLTTGKIPAEHSSAGAGGAVTTSGSSQEPLKPSSEFLLPIRLSSGH